VKIRSIRHNNRKKVFEVGTSTKRLVFPFSKATPTPTTDDPVTELSVDAEAGREAFTYVLRSGRTGTVHVEQVLEYNQDPTYLRDLLLYRLTLEAQKRVARRSCIAFSIRRTTASLSIRCWPCCKCSTVTWTWSFGRRLPDATRLNANNRDICGPKCSLVLMRRCSHSHPSPTSRRGQSPV
jgi:hypothetical protein